MAGVLQSLKCCLNPKVLVGLGAVLVGVLLLAPNLVASAFPLVLALVCPLSMLVMMGGMARMGSRKGGSATQDAGAANDAAVPVSPAARLAVLRATQQALAEQSAAVASEIASLKAAEAAAGSMADQRARGDRVQGAEALAATAAVPRATA